MGQGQGDDVAAPIHARRLTAQLLSGRPARDPVAVAERILAIQAQDLRGARLAIRARTRGRSVADVDRALGDDRSLLITTLNRGTLHMVRREDYPWLLALTAPTSATANAARLRQEGVSPTAATRALRIIARALGDEGPLTRARLREHLDAANVPTAGQALAHILMLAALRGLIVRGPMAGREQAYVLVRDWLGPLESIDRPRALAELARRYLAGHGPASERDLAKWSGLGLRDVRAGLAAIASELVDDGDGLLDLAPRRRAAPVPKPRLLGSFEPLLMGWTSRRPVLGEHGSLVTVNGIFRQFVLVGGRAVGTWRLERGAVEAELFDDVDAAAREALVTDAADVRRYLGFA